MKTIILAAGLAGGLLFSTIPGQCLEPQGGIDTRILLQDNSQGTVRAVSDKSTFYDGQRFKLAVKSRRAGYLYVLCQTSRGETKVLHPSTGFAGNSIEPGEYTTFPQRGWFRFDEDPGREQVFVIVANDPIAELDQAGQDGGDISPSLLQHYSEPLSRDNAEPEARGIETTGPPVSAVKRIVLRHDSRGF
jgi:hypothetical protein